MVTLNHLKPQIKARGKIIINNYYSSYRFNNMKMVSCFVKVLLSYFRHQGYLFAQMHLASKQMHDASKMHAKQKSLMTKIRPN